MDDYSTLCDEELLKRLEELARDERERILLDRTRPIGVCVVLSTCRHRRRRTDRRTRRRASTVDHDRPRRSNICRRSGVQVEHPILDQSRFRCCGCRPSRQHRIWTRLPAASERQLGHRRCRRCLRGSALARRSRLGRPRTAGDQRWQRRRIHDACRACQQRCVRSGSEPLRSHRLGRACSRHAQVRVPVPRRHDRTVAGGGGRLHRAFAAEPPR